MEIYTKFIEQITLYQYKINTFIATTIRQLDNDGNTLVGSLLVLSISFLYGLVHAAGPGHGKALVAFYFTTSKNNYSQAFRLGYFISVVHAFSALVFTFCIYFLLQTMFRKNFEQVSLYAMQVSAVMIILVGLYIISSSYITRRKKEQEIKTNKSKYALAISVGIVPCLGVMIGVLAPIWAWIFLSEVPVLNTILGGLIILATLIINSLYLVKVSKRKEKIVSVVA